MDRVVSQVLYFVLYLDIRKLSLSIHLLKQKISCFFFSRIDFSSSVDACRDRWVKRFHSGS